MDAYLRLYNTNGVSMLTSNDDNNDPDTGTYTLDSYIEWSFAGAGTYYIEVASCCVGTGGPGQWYELYIEPEGGSCPDVDGDGYYANVGCGTAVDCDDGNSTVYPGAPEFCDGKDNQCPGDAGYGQVDELCADEIRLIDIQP